MKTFSDLGLAASVLEGLNRAGYDKPTPIQVQAIPPAILGHDILGIAQTGTGKTAAFALPILHKMATSKQIPPRKGARTLILSPTRELASQIAESFTLLASDMSLSIATVFGGVKHAPQARKLARGVDVLVATPGRLLDHIASGTLQLSQTEVLVMDEADQMLDLGFLKPIRTVVSHLPSDRQILFFSATMPASISQLARDFLRDPKRISVTPVSTTAERISQRVIHIGAGEKRLALASLIRNQKMERTIVFARTKRGADRVAKHLEGAGIRAAAIHGNKSQNQRERALEAFRHSKVQVLVATDIAARGIDIDGVSHVINYELPETPEAYVHRIGRTARAGASGSAISFCDGPEIKYLHSIEKLIRQKIPSEDYRDAKSCHNGGLDSAAGTGSQAAQDKTGAGVSARLKATPPKSHKKRTGKQNVNPPQKSGARRSKPNWNSSKRKTSSQESHGAVKAV
ncbi:MAG: DEAD/DEAH box helicase [Pseudomonadota bacterium]